MSDICPLQEILWTFSCQISWNQVTENNTGAKKCQKITWKMILFFIFSIIFFKFVVFRVKMVYFSFSGNKKHLWTFSCQKYFFKQAITTLPQIINLPIISQCNWQILDLGKKLFKQFSMIGNCFNKRKLIQNFVCVLFSYFFRIFKKNSSFFRKKD